MFGKRSTASDLLLDRPAKVVEAPVAKKVAAAAPAPAPASRDPSPGRPRIPVA